MFCKYCGTKLADTASFCYKCGKPTGRSNSQPPQAEQPVRQAPVEPPKAPEPPKREEPVRQAPVEPPKAPEPPKREEPVWQDPVEPMESQPEERKPRRSGGYIALVVVLCVLVIGAVVALVMAMTSLKPSSTPEAQATPSPSATMEPQLSESVPPEEDDQSLQTPGQNQSGYPLQLDMDKLLTARIEGITFREAWDQGRLQEWMNLYVNGSSDSGSSYEAYWYDENLHEWTYYGFTYSQAAAAGWGDIWLELLGNQDGDDPATATEGYLLPTDSRYIDKSELAPFTKEEVILIRNEIYARYGYQFSSQELQDYFNRQSWYVPVEGLNASTFDTSVFNAYEQANLETILAYEREMGWRA